MKYLSGWIIGLTFVALIFVGCGGQSQDSAFLSPASPGGIMQSATGDAELIVGNTPQNILPLLTKPVTGQVLLYHSDGSGGFEANDLKNNLVATGLITAGQIDIINMTFTPLPLSTLLTYHCVYVWANFSPPNPVAQGDRLKEYVDAGGTVVLCTYALSPTNKPWEMQGGIMADGYNPLDLTTTDLSPFPRSLDFGSALTGHSLLDGVTDFSYGGNSNYAVVTLDPGATLVGSDNYGVPLLAVSASGRVVGVNLYPGPYFTKSPGVYRTLANACALDQVIQVDIDIKPGSYPNSINLKSKGVIPVAILTTDTFDATTVDGSTVVFAGASPAHGSGHLEDVDGDGDMDWVGHFRTQETTIAPGDTEAGLAGKTTGGQDIEGSDSISITPGSSKGK